MSSVKIVLVLLVLCCIDMLGSADALQQDAEGVCVVKTSTRRTRAKTFAAQIKKMCGKRKCVVRKTKVEVFTVTKNQTVCCNGYGYRSEDDSCTPLCSTGCNGGRCVAPDVCHCDPPATLDEEHKNACIMPTCEPPCVNGACVANDTCQCNTGFIEYNSTHCYHCDPGYAIDMTFNCAPICDQPCVNGHCIGPNICGCPSGYKLKDKFTCEPVCDSPCINSTCTAPNVCSCFEGYTDVNSTCIPRCISCDNGLCVGPNVCVCNDGFTKADGGCLPTCDETCVNGVCSGPNICSCNDGYVKDNSSYSRCFKPCSGECKEGCDENGTCIDCSVPTRVRKQVRGRGKTPAKPTYKLVCCDGWMYDVATQKCVFHCRFGCERGKCVGPNKCSCDPPLILENNKCVDPVCDPPCVNGKCGGNNICLCDPGYEKVNTTHCAPICLPGYEHPCFNGSCKATNNMTAWDIDAVNSDPFSCIPKCAQDCINGACVAPDVCKCHEGYTNESHWKCSPVCDYCENGTCVAPNECQCFDGYSKKDGKTCTPDCETPCEHGVCTEPDVCTCDSGYELQYTITNNNITQETCQPVCSEVCINGHCESPDTCACDPGFISDDIHPSICYKPCPGLCENGVCTRSGKCDCQRGYVLENETCISMTPVNCETCGGNCTTEDICWCSNDRPCFFPAEVESAEIASSTMLAGLGLTWMVGGAVGLLLLILVIVVIGQMWRKRKEYPTNEGNNFSSVAYTVPNTLLQVREEIKPENDYDVVDDQDLTKAAGEALLEETTVIDDKMYD